MKPEREGAKISRIFKGVLFVIMVQLLFAAPLVWGGELSGFVSGEGRAFLEEGKALRLQVNKSEQSLQ